MIVLGASLVIACWVEGVGDEAVGVAVSMAQRGTITGSSCCHRDAHQPH